VRAIISAVRPRQWVKNLLVLAAPAAAGVLTHHVVITHTAVAFGAFCLAASGVYLINDVKDVTADRLHPAKKSRAIAAGELPASWAVALGVLLLAGSGALSQADGVNLGLGVIMGIYVVNSILYSLFVKRIAVVELGSVAAGFLLRALAGAAASHLFVSSWFLVVVSFGALFIVVGKRTAEVHRLGERAVEHRAVLSNYSESFLNSALTLTAGVTATGYCLWAFDRTPTGLSVARHELLPIRLSVVPVVLAILHVLRLLESGGGGAPEELVFEDRLLQVLGIVWAVCMGFGVYT
jgi:decaprenyl-phosphate phosphoribosyltransferase